MKRIQVNGRNTSEFVPTAVIGAPNAIAIDWIARNLFWANAAAGLMEVNVFIYIFYKINLIK